MPCGRWGSCINVAFHFPQFSAMQLLTFNLTMLDPLIFKHLVRSRHALSVGVHIGLVSANRSRTVANTLVDPDRNGRRPPAVTRTGCHACLPTRMIMSLVSVITLSRHGGGINLNGRPQSEAVWPDSEETETRTRPGCLL